MKKKTMKAYKLIVDGVDGTDMFLGYYVSKSLARKKIKKVEEENDIKIPKNDIILEPICIQME